MSYNTEGEIRLEQRERMARGGRTRAQAADGTFVSKETP